MLAPPALEARKLITKKNKRDYTDKGADLQEEDTDYLESVRNAYLQLATDACNWQIVPVFTGDRLRSIGTTGMEFERITTRLIDK